MPIGTEQCVVINQQDSAKEHFGNHQFINRSKTVPIIKFRYHPATEEESEESLQNGKLQYISNTHSFHSPPEEALSPVTRSQNLLEAAINSLNRQVEEQQQFQVNYKKVHS